MPSTEGSDLGNRNALLILGLVLVCELAAQLSLRAATTPAIAMAAITLIFAPLFEEAGRWTIAIGRTHYADKLRGLALYTGAILIIENLRRATTVRDLPSDVPLILRFATYFVVAAPASTAHILNALIALKASEKLRARWLIAAALGLTLVLHVVSSALGPNLVTWFARNSGLAGYLGSR